MADLNYEVIQEHELQDIYRLESGYILKVNKYKWIQGGLWSVHKKHPVTKVKGIKDCFKLKEDYLDWNKKIHTAGTIIFESSVIEPVENLEDYWIELKFSGGAFQGTFEEYQVFIEKIGNILKKYK